MSFDSRFILNLERLICRTVIDAIKFEASQGEITALPGLLRELREYVALTKSSSVSHPPCDKCHTDDQISPETQQEQHLGLGLLQSLDQTLSELLLEISQESQGNDDVSQALNTSSPLGNSSTNTILGREPHTDQGGQS